MKDLKIGDDVLTGSGTFSPILGWLDKQQGLETEFLKIDTNLTSSISLTSSHVIFTWTDEEQRVTEKYSEHIKLKDIIIHEESGQKGEVIRISKFSSQGYYSPLTLEGTVVVDGFLASCYASYPHWVANMALFPARTWPSIFLGADGDAEGTGSFVKLIKKIGDMMQLRNAAVPALFVMDAAKEEF